MGTLDADEQKAKAKPLPRRKRFIAAGLVLVWFFVRKFCSDNPAEALIPVQQLLPPLPEDDGEKAQLTLVSTLPTFDAAVRNCSTAHMMLLAMHSWFRVAEHVVILADDPAMCVTLAMVWPTVHCVPHDCMHVLQNRPIMSCMLLTAVGVARHDTVMFTNPDMVYSPLAPTINAARLEFTKFLIVGRRTDIDAPLSCSRRPFTYDDDLVRLGKRNGTLHEDYGIDYFIFSKGALPLKQMPPFLIGNWKWDNWLLGVTIRRNITRVIDATATVTATHLKTNKVRAQQRAGAQYNEALYNDFMQDTLELTGPEGLGRIRFSLFYTGIKNDVLYVKQNYRSMKILDHLNAIEKNQQNILTPLQ